MKLLEERQRKDLVLYSPINCFKHSHKIRTVKDVLNLPSKSLGEFKRNYGRDWVIGYISMWLIDLNDSTNVKTRMSDVQIEFTAERIFDSYSLRVTDLTLFFRNIKEGVYGQFYENLGQEKILEWLRKYFDLRCEYAEMLSDRDKKSFEDSIKSLPKETIDKIFEGVGEDKIEHDHEKNGLGKRINKVITKDLLTTIKSEKTELLKEYLINNDINYKTYDETIYKLIETELDLRNKITK